MKRAVPRPVDDHRSPPKKLCDGLWVLDRQLRHFGLARLPSRTTIVRLGDGSLVVISPPPGIDSTSAAALDSIGTVAYGVVPNSFHYLFASGFLERYPAARLLVTPGLPRRVPELGSATELGPRPPEAWSGELEYTVLGPVRGVSESLLFHVPSRTLILTDLAFNMLAYPRPFDRFFWRLSGVPARFGPGRTSRSLLLRDREAASRCLSRALAWPIRRIVVAHGDTVETDAADELRRAFSRYLPDVIGTGTR